CLLLSVSSFDATAPLEIYTLSLHDALPISFHRLLGRRRARASPEKWAPGSGRGLHGTDGLLMPAGPRMRIRLARWRGPSRPQTRSEEHTSELQSRENLVCRLLLEKKKKQKK